MPILFEGLLWLLFGLCLWHAAQHGMQPVRELILGAVYGCLLEWVTLRQLHAYQYGPFLLVIDGVPVCIGLGWAVIIYCAMTTTDHIALPAPVRPVLDALLALAADLGMDAAAVRLGLWSWQGVGGQEQWFGIPWANFLAWFIIVWSYAGFTRAMRPLAETRRYRWLAAPFAVTPSMAIFLIAIGLYQWLGAALDGRLATLALLIGSLAIVLEGRPQVERVRAADWLPALPLVLHGFVIVASLAAGLYWHTPALALLELASVVLLCGVNGWLWWPKLGNRIKSKAE